MLKLVAAGHPSGNDPHKVTNMVAAGLDEAAHVANPDHAVQEIIDRNQHVAAAIKPELEHTARAVVSNPVAAVAHTWKNERVIQTPLDYIHIPVFGE